MSKFFKLLAKISYVLILILVVLFIAVRRINNNFTLNIIKHKTHYDSKNIFQKISMDVLSLRAKTNDTIAMVNLGIILSSKYYTDTPDPSYSVKLWKKVAQKGNSHAQYLLGVSYCDGIGGLIKDKKEYFKWLKKY